jgi:hypothetical protein
VNDRTPDPAPPEVQSQAADYAALLYPVAMVLLAIVGVLFIFKVFV